MAPVDPVATCSTQITLMCCSAQVEAACQKLIRMIGATLSLQEFAVLYPPRPGQEAPEGSEVMDDAFRAGASAAERGVWAEIH